MNTAISKKQDSCIICASIRKVAFSLSLLFKLHIRDGKAVPQFLKQQGLLKREQLVFVTLDSDNFVLSIRKMTLRDSLEHYRKEFLNTTRNIEVRRTLVVHIQKGAQPEFTGWNKELATTIIKQGLTTGTRIFDYVIATKNATKSLRDTEPSVWSYVVHLS